MKMGPGLLVFLLGLGLGIGAPYLIERYFRDYLPPFLAFESHPLKGEVVRKQREPDRLLVTIVTEEGTILATFRQHLDEIDLLVEEGNAITIAVPGYEPFVTDPRILRVGQARQALPGRSSPPSESRPDVSPPDAGQTPEDAPTPPDSPVFQEIPASP